MQTTSNSTSFIMLKRKTDELSDMQEDEYEDKEQDPTCWYAEAQQFP